MIRKLYLINQDGIRFDFSYENKCILTDLNGLGITVELSYLKFAEDYVRVDKNNPLSEISGTLIFLDGYVGYKKFINFIQKQNTELKLYYESDELKYILVDIKTITKKDLSFNALFCSIVFDKKSLWLSEIKSVLELLEDTRGKVYPYKYPFTYSSSFEGKIRVTNNGAVKASLRVEMSGNVNNPEVTIKSNDNDISRLKLNLIEEDVLIVVDANVTDQKIIKVKNGVTTDIYHLQDFSEDNFLFLPVGTFDISFLPGSGPATCKITFTEGHLGN